MKTIALWAFLLGTVRCGEYSDISKCAADPKNINLKIYCNPRGHWQAQVQQERTDVEEDVAALDVDIDQTYTPLCNGSGSVLLVANITVPPQGNVVVKTKFHKRIPEGYRQFSEGHYFKVYKELVLWLEARDICDKEGAHLALINSEAERRFLSAMWPATSVWAHVGYSDIYEEGNFVTIHNQSIRGAEYPKWAAGEPNGGVGENCVMLHSNTYVYDLSCIITAAFFCELEY